MKQLILILSILFICYANNYAKDKVSEVDSLIQIHIQNVENLIDTEHINLLIQIGDALKSNTPDSSVYYYNIALEIGKKNSNPEKEAQLLGRIGGAKYIQGEYNNALDYFVKALNIWRNLKNKKGIAIGLNNIALIYNMLDRNEEALKNHENSALLCIEIGDSTLLAINYFNISIVNLALNNYDSALTYADKSSQLNTLLNNEDELLKICNIKGNIFYEQGNYLKAKDSYLKVITAKDFHNKWEMSFALAGLAATEQSMGNIEKSITYGKRSLQLAKEVKAQWDIQNVTKILSESYALIGDYEDAYKYYKEYKIYSDKIFNEEKKTKINYLLLKQDDFEYIMLAKENEFQTERIQKKNNQMLLFAIAFMFLVILAIFLYNTNRLKTKLNTQLLIKNDEIANKNKELTQLNATKDAFFKVIGHDLKSPMSTVVSFTDLLQNNLEIFTNKEIVEYVGLTNKSANIALDLLDNLLEWAKAQTGITKVKPVKTNILQLIKQVISHIQSMLTDKNITLNIDANENIYAILDKNLTAAIIRNLLTNAIKFTHKNGEISISAQKESLSVLIIVSDNGVGMSKEKLDNLLQIENAVSSSGTENEKGSGIGLILCKYIVDKQGGEIWAESELGKGSSFYLRI